MATLPLLFPSFPDQELPFSKAQPVLRAALLPGLAKPAWDPSITPAMLTYVPITLTYSAAEQPIFAALAAEYTPAVPGSRKPAGIIRKDLPESFMAATGFAAANPEYFTSVDGFGCAIGSQTPNTAQTPSYTIAWGEILSYALRQPLICQAMGLAYLQVSIPLDPAQVSVGGWIWLEIDTSDLGNWYAQLVAEKPASVSTYAARLPALTTAQDVFAAILFPTVPRLLRCRDHGRRAIRSRPVPRWLREGRSRQPTHHFRLRDRRHRHHRSRHRRRHPDRMGRRTGHHLDQSPDPDRASHRWRYSHPGAALHYPWLPRRCPPGSTDPWASLCAASGTLNAASVFTTSFTAQDLCVEPTPVQNAGAGQQYWLPRYFAQWRGRTLVVNDKYGYAFSGGQPPASGPVTDSDFTGTLTESLSGINLLYGDNYEFRTRLADLTGGGPSSTDASPSDAGITTVPFRRYVPPKKVVLTLGNVDSSGNQSLTVDRPSINYPEMVFTGAADQSTLDALYALTPPQPPVRPFPPPGRLEHARGPAISGRGPRLRRPHPANHRRGRSPHL